MTISYVGSTTVAPPNIVNTEAIYTLTAPTGLAGPTLIVVTNVLGGVGSPAIVGLPSNWAHVGGTGRSDVYVFPWKTGDATSWTVVANGNGAGYVAWTVVAYNGAVFDTCASVTTSAQSPPVTTSTPYDWLASIFFTCKASSAGTQTCTAMTVRSSSEWITTEASYGGVYGIAVADTAAIVPQGLSSDSDYVWAPTLSTLTTWGTVTVAMSGALTPSLPTNYTPTNGAYVDFSTEQYFVAAYNNNDSSTCQAYQFRLKTSGGSYTYWNAGSAAFQSTAVWNTGPSNFTLPAGVLSNSNTYNWSFNTESSYETTLTSGFAADLTVIGQPEPTVTVTAPTGTVPTATPTVTWVASAGGSATLTSYQVVTYATSTVSTAGFTPGQSAGLLDNSGVVTGTSASHETGFLPNGTAVESFVQVTQSGNETSAWESTSYTVSYAVPPTPTLSTSGAGFDSNGAPVVALTIVAAADSTTSGALTAAVYYIDADTPTPMPVRATAPVSASGQIIVIADYEATFGVARTYYAVIVSADDGPSNRSNTVSVTLTSNQCVLSDPLNPTLFLVLHRLAGQSSSASSVQAQTSIEIDRSRDQTIFYPFGKSTATVQYGSVYAPTFTLNFWLDGYADAAMYDALWASTHTLLLRTDMGDAWYVDAGPTRPLSILSDGPNRVFAPQYVGSLNCTTTDKP